MFKMMGVTGVVIMIMLFITYRSISTVLLILVMVGFEMGRPEGLSPSSAITICWDFRHLSLPCSRRWRSRPEPITRYS
ncbi:MMPL family protein [Mycobacterium xenopi 3993]|nr:MMPL family protein [Mycobacterium xenopi 3993]